MLIYFESDDKNNIVTKMASHLKSEAFLYIGHSESLASDDMLCG